MGFAADTITRRMLVDTCVVTAGPSGPGTLNESTLAVTRPAPAQLYGGPCKVERAGATEIRAVDFGGADVAQADLTVRLPVTATGSIRPGATVTVTTSADPALVDAALEVLGVEVGTMRLTRRLVCRRRVAATRTGGQAL